MLPLPAFINTAPFTLRRPLINRNFSTCAARSVITATMSDRKMLHAVYRVANLPGTRKFLEALGMHVLRERDVPSEKYTNVFYGFGPEQRGEYFSLELTYNYGVDSYEVGTGFGHIGVAVSDVAAVVERVREAGFKVTREAGPVAGGDVIIAFVEDPTGYKFEIIQNERRDPVCQVTLRVTDLEKATAFYKAMGMSVFKTWENEEGKYSMTKMGFGTAEDSTVVSLVYNWGDHTYTNGDGYGQIAVSCPDVYDAAKQFEDAGIAVTRAPGPVPGIGTKICAVTDPDGWKTVMVDADDFEKEFE